MNVPRIKKLVLLFHTLLFQLEIQSIIWCVLHFNDSVGVVFPLVLSTRPKAFVNSSWGSIVEIATRITFGMRGGLNVLSVLSLVPRYILNWEGIPLADSGRVLLFPTIICLRVMNT